MLELKDVLIKDGHAHLTYCVRHNVGALPTVLEQDLALRVNLDTGKVHGQLILDELSAASLDEAREKMAWWCERMAAALRAPLEQTTPLVPAFTRAVFDPTALRPYLAQAYCALIGELQGLAHDDQQDVLKRWIQDRHPLILVPGALDSALKAAGTLPEQGTDDAN